MTESTVVLRSSSASELAAAPRFFIVFPENKNEKPIPYIRRAVAEVELARLGKEGVVADLIESHDRKSPAGKILASSLTDGKKGTKSVKNIRAALEAARERAAKADPNDKIASAKKTAAKSAAKATEKAERSPRGAVDTRAIKLLVSENPKREGSASYQLFELYRSSKTVGDYLAAGGTRAGIAWDSAHGYIELSK